MRAGAGRGEEMHLEYLPEQEGIDQHGKIDNYLRLKILLRMTSVTSYIRQALHHSTDLLLSKL